MLELYSHRINLYLTSAEVIKTDPVNHTHRITQNFRSNPDHSLALGYLWNALSTTLKALFRWRNASDEKIIEIGQRILTVAEMFSRQGFILDPLIVSILREWKSLFFKIDASRRSSFRFLPVMISKLIHSSWNPTNNSGGRISLLMLNMEAMILLGEIISEFGISHSPEYPLVQIESKLVEGLKSCFIAVTSLTFMQTHAYQSFDPKLLPSLIKRLFNRFSPSDLASILLPLTPNSACSLFSFPWIIDSIDKAVVRLSRDSLSSLVSSFLNALESNRGHPSFFILRSASLNNDLM